MLRRSLYRCGALLLALVIPLGWANTGGAQVCATPTPPQGAAKPTEPTPVPASGPAYGEAPAPGKSNYYSEDYTGPMANGALGISHSAHLRVRLPAQAELWVDGAKTKQAGAERTFLTRDLDPERIYTWPIKARWIEDGFTVEKTLQVRAIAGSRLTINFVQPPAPALAPVAQRAEAPPPLPRVERRPFSMSAPVP
jgi:uncharacterized protein (TIGR03000 family)